MDDSNIIKRAAWFSLAWGKKEEEEENKEKQNTNRKKKVKM